MTDKKAVVTAVDLTGADKAGSVTSYGICTNGDVVIAPISGVKGASPQDILKGAKTAHNTICASVPDGGKHPFPNIKQLDIAIAGPRAVLKGKCSDGRDIDGALVTDLPNLQAKAEITANLINEKFCKPKGLGI